MPKEVKTGLPDEFYEEWETATFDQFLTAEEKEWRSISSRTPSHGLRRGQQFYNFLSIHRPEVSTKLLNTELDTYEHMFLSQDTLDKIRVIWDDTKPED